MIVSVDFSSLVTFDCAYGDLLIDHGSVRVFVEKGLIVKSSRLIRAAGQPKIVECVSGEHDDSKVSDIFPLHYIYDPANNVAFFDWELSGGLLSARDQDGRWIKYTSKSESLFAMHEYVGGCWFVFSGVTFLRCVINKRKSDEEERSAEEFFEGFKVGSVLEKLGAKYFLEGSVSVAPGPGWMSLEIYAESFHLEIPDSD